MSEPKCLTRMKLSECWGDSLNIEELKEVNAYIEYLQQRIDKAIELIQNGRDGKGQSYVDFVRYVSIDDDKELLSILQGKEME